jgi:hypothetical protein
MRPWRRPVIYPGVSLSAVQCLIRLFRTKISALRQVLLDPHDLPRAVPGSLPPCCRCRIFTGSLPEIVAAYARKPDSWSIRLRHWRGHERESGRTGRSLAISSDAHTDTPLRAFRRAAYFGLSNGIGVSAEGKQLFDAVWLISPTKITGKGTRQPSERPALP